MAARGIARLRKIDGYWVLATPADHGGDGLVASCRAAAYLLSYKVPVYCPLAHRHGLVLHGGPDSANANLWQAAEAPLMHGAHGLLVLMLPGWELSPGLIGAIRGVKAVGKPVRFLDPEDLT